MRCLPGICVKAAIQQPLACRCLPVWDLWDLWLRSVNLDGREHVFAAGSYVLVRPAYASPALDNIDPDDDELVAELEEGQSIELTEIVYLEEMQRVPRAQHSFVLAAVDF